MLNHESVPLVQLYVRELDAVALHSWHVVALRQYPVHHLILLVDVALEAAVALGEAVEKHG